MLSFNRIVLIGVCTLWIAAMTWEQFFNLPAGEMENHSSQLVRDRMNDCSGTFQQRYDCKNAIVIENDRMNFFDALGRFAIIFIPPILLAGGLHALAHRHDQDGDNEEMADETGYRRRYHRRRGNRQD